MTRRASLTYMLLIGVVTVLLLFFVTKENSQQSAVTTARDDNYTASEAAFVAGSRGLISVPASKFSGQKDGGSGRWQIADPDDRELSAFMRVVPVDGAGSKTDDASSRPRLDYSVTFDKKGLYYIWVRGNGPTNGSGLDFGLNGQAFYSSSRISGFGPRARRFYQLLAWPRRTYKWSRLTANGVPGYFEITEAGTYSVNVWPIHDETMFDKIVFSSDYDFKPQGIGPQISGVAARRLTPPTFSRSSGMFFEETAVTITGLSGSEVLYTLDGSDPYTSSSAEIAADPIVVAESLTIRAGARASGSTRSDIAGLSLVKAKCRPYRIMPMGDSITLGIFGPINAGPLPSDQGGYRAPLYRRLVSSGYAVDFVGQLRAGQDLVPTIDTDHEGHDGWTSQQIAEDVYRFLSLNSPDIILLHVGTNGFNVEIDDVEAILDEIDRFEIDHKQSVTVLLAMIINRRERHPETSQYNNNLDRLASKRAASGDKITIVDMESALRYPEDLYDNLHPNQNGYERMSEVWFDALVAQISRCTNLN